MIMHRLFRLGIHLPFWLVLAVLSGWTVSLRTQHFDQELIALIHSGLEESEKESWEAAQAVLTRIQNEDLHLKYELWKRRARTAVDRTDRINGKLKAWEQQLAGNTLPPVVLLNELSALTDSFYVFCEQDRIFNPRLLVRRLDTTRHIAWQPAFWANASRKDWQMVVQCLRLEVLSNLVGLLDYYSRHMFGFLNTECDGFSYCEPMLSAKNSVPLAGELYQADIFLSSLVCHTGYMGLNININGDTLPLTSGMAEYSRRFRQPGEHRLKTDFHIQKYGTEKEELVSKTFTVHVLPACPARE
jgi:hypothetical protein